MKKKFVFTLICLFLTSGFLFAQQMPPTPGGMGNPPKMGHQMMEKGKHPNPEMIKIKIMTSFFLDPMTGEYLGITDEQTAKLEKIKADHGKKMIDYRAEIQKLRIDMHTLMLDSNIDIAAARALLQKISSIETSMKVEGLSAFNNARSILTADQKAKLEKLWKGKDIPELKNKMMKGKHEEKCDESPDSDLGMGLMPDENR